MKKRKKIQSLEINSGVTLEFLINQLKDRGITDLSRVSVEMNCCYCDNFSDDPYYSGLQEPYFEDVRLEWKE